MTLKDVAVACVMALGTAALMLSCAGCATVRASAKPGAAKPCVTTLPTPVKLEAIGDPDRLAYLDDDGEARVALRIAVDLDKLRALFGYVEALRGIAEHARGCLSR